ncbi:MAG: helix-turn-helix transcriptional regulator [Kiritimatiellae bacterium]|nr:helix-turn-helix transcriptional regulator [Kiritimatiellia bacterium]
MARRKTACLKRPAQAWLDAVLSGRTAVSLVHAGHPLYAEPFAYDLRRTIPHHLIYLVLGGACRFTFAHGTERVDPVSLVWVMPGVSYEIDATDDMMPADISDIRFSVREDDRELRLAEDFLHVRQAGRLIEPMELAVSELTVSSPFHAARVRALVALVCSYALDRSEGPARDQARFNNAQQTWLLRYVDKRIDQRLNSALLAQKMGFSRDYFARVFRRTFGLSPRVWLKRRRMQRAVTLLLQPRLRVAEIARRLGYDSHHLFSRQFKQVYRCSPMEWRRKT